MGIVGHLEVQYTPDGCLEPHQSLHDYCKPRIMEMSSDVRPIAEWPCCLPAVMPAAPLLVALLSATLMSPDLLPASTNSVTSC